MKMSQLKIKLDNTTYKFESIPRTYNEVLNLINSQLNLP